MTYSRNVQWDRCNRVIEITRLQHYRYKNIHRMIIPGQQHFIHSFINIHLFESRWSEVLQNQSYIHTFAIITDTYFTDYMEYYSLLVVIEYMVLEWDVFNILNSSDTMWIMDTHRVWWFFGFGARNDIDFNHRKTESKFFKLRQFSRIFLWE